MGKTHATKQRDSKRERDRRAIDLLPQGTPISQGFWASPSLEELAEAQNIQPMANVRDLFGTWPGEKDDGFEAAVDQLRHSEMKGIDQS